MPAWDNDAVQLEDDFRACSTAIRWKRRRTMMRPPKTRPRMGRPLPPLWRRRSSLNASVATGSNECWAQGGFGLVYLAHDDQLSRPVAIKVPHRKLVDRLEDAEAYLTEARTVAEPRSSPHRPRLRCRQHRAVPLFHRLEIHRRHRPRHKAQAVPAFDPRNGRTGGDRGRGAAPRPQARAGPSGHQARATSCSTRAASRSWRISGWPCGSRTWARGHATPERPLT